MQAHLPPQRLSCEVPDRREREAQPKESGVGSACEAPKYGSLIDHPRRSPVLAWRNLIVNEHYTQAMPCEVPAKSPTEGSGDRTPYRGQVEREAQSKGQPQDSTDDCSLMTGGGYESLV